MEDRARFLLFTLIVASCAPRAAERSELCPTGTIATTDGCAPVPNWNPWARDAGADAGSPQPEPKDAEPAVDAGIELDAEPPDAGEPSLDLSGTWAVRTINAQTVSSQIFQPQTVVFVALSIVSIDGALRPTSKICSLVGSPYGGATTAWPPAAIDAFVVLEESASAEELEVGAPFTFTRTQLLGWYDRDPFAELPESENDPRVYDADGDDNPGVTLEVSGTVDGEMYVVSRSEMNADGIIVSTDRIEGPCMTEQEQNVLDASNELLAYSRTWSEPIREMSSFTMIRVDERIDCAVLIDVAEQLFTSQ